MSWNNSGPGPWGNPGGNQGGGSPGGGGSSGGGSSGGGSSGGGQGGGSKGGGGGNGGDEPPNGPWGGEPGGNRGGGGGGGRRGGPFPGGPFGPNGPFPDFEHLIQQAQAFIRNLLPGGRGIGFGGLTILVAVVVALWFASGFYRVQPDEQGIVLRFGAYKYWTPPGLHWHIPWPVEEVELPAVTRINRTEIGFRSSAGRVEAGADTTGRDVLAESLMLTGDENIIDIQFVVFWRIRLNAASKFLFNARRPADLVFGVAESSMREVIGRTPIEPALAQLRAQIESDVMKQTQEILDRYDVGIEITEVNMGKVDRPAAVIESQIDVQRANTDAERMRNEAEAYHNDIVPRARGEAARLLAEAQGIKQATIAEATGQSQRFDVVFAAYQQAKDITLRRMYLDAMQSVLTHAKALVVDDKLKGLVPFLPLNVPGGGPTPPPTPPAGGPAR
jgi:membrane protease subunit HflK